MSNSGARSKIIFFGNGALSEYALAALEENFEVVFHARTREDLEKAVEIKKSDSSVFGVLASFGVLIPTSVLEVFEPEGILNIHPSLLPLYRGASPIESAILDGRFGDEELGVSVMKLVKAMDAGPIYKYATLTGVTPEIPDLKNFLYKTLAEMGASMIFTLLTAKKWPKPTPQDDSKATYCSKFEKKDGLLDPSTETAERIFLKIIAFQGFPKAKFAFYGKNCAILEAHICEVGETALLPLKCVDGRILSIDRLQPDGKKPMDAKSFLNGYAK